MARNDLLAIVWSPHEARTAAFAEWLGAELHNVHFLLEKRPWIAPLKYILQSLATWWLLLRKRPRFVYVTNSPPFAGLCVMLYCALTPTRFVLDTHPPSLFGRKWSWARPIQRFTARRAAMNVTDQERFARLFREWDAPVMVLENPPKLNLPERPAAYLPAQPTVCYIGTFASDEPVAELLGAARLLPDVRFYVLGKVALAGGTLVAGAPENVEFTGYLMREQYWERLYRAHAIVVLTSHAHSLSGAAQDAMYIDSPLVLSDQPTLKEYFTKGAVFASNTAEAIAAGVREAVDNHHRLKTEMAELRLSTTLRWQDNFQALRELVRGAGDEQKPNELELRGTSVGDSARSDLETVGEL